MAAKLIKQTRGRPSFDIREETLTFLLEKGFKVPVIAQLLMVSSRTVERRMNKYGLTVSGTYSDINDEQLDHLVHEAQREQPGIGLRLLMWKLRSKGIRIQWERLRYSLLRTDPTGVHLR